MLTTPGFLSVRPAVRRFCAVAVGLGMATAGLLLPVTPAHALCLPTPDNQNCPPPSPPSTATDTSQFDVLLATPLTDASYYSVYSLTPVGWTHSVGTVYFYMGPTGDSATEALELAAASAPDTVKADVLHAEAQYGTPTITPPNVDTNTQTTGAQPMCGNHNRICQRYEEMKYCIDGDPTKSGDGGCSDASRTVDGVFSYDNNGAYASDNGDFVDCSQSTSYYNSGFNPPEDRHISVSWCGYWNQGPWSSNANTQFMDYGMNVSPYWDGNSYSAWIRLDDYAGCGSVGNRGGSNQ